MRMQVKVKRPIKSRAAHIQQVSHILSGFALVNQLACSICSGVSLSVH
jgi:hypothetical protein